MFKHWREIVHNHDNGYLDWLFHQNAFPLRESTFNSIKTFSKFSGGTLKIYLLLNCISYTYDQRQLLG